MARRERSTRQERRIKGAPTARDFKVMLIPIGVPVVVILVFLVPYKTLMPNSVVAIMIISL